MTIELVDGHGGKPHISGDDLGDFKAGILGDAGYVFKRADMLAATLNGANSLTVNTGSGILPVSGRHFRITAPETVAVTSGTQGQNRNDLVVIRPSTSTDGTTVENASVVVLRGTPTDGDAVDPEKEDTDLALYRLQLTGISVADPIALFDVMVPYNEFRDSIYQAFEYTLIKDGYVLMRKGHLCILRVYNVVISSLAAGKTSWQATLPEGIVPQIYMSNALLSSSGKARVAVDTDRHVEISTSNEALSNATLNGQLVFPIK